MLTASRIRRGQTHHRRRTLRTSGDDQSSLPVPQALRAPFCSPVGLRSLAGRNLLHELPGLHVQGFRDAVDVYIDHRFPGFLYLPEDRFTCLQGHDHNAVRPAPVSGIHPPTTSLSVPMALRAPSRLPSLHPTDPLQPPLWRPARTAIHEAINDAVHNRAAVPSPSEPLQPIFRPLTAFSRSGPSSPPSTPSRPFLPQSDASHAPILPFHHPQPVFRLRTLTHPSLIPSATPASPAPPAAPRPFAPQRCTPNPTPTPQSLTWPSRALATDHHQQPSFFPTVHLVESRRTLPKDASFGNLQKATSLGSSKERTSRHSTPPSVTVSDSCYVTPRPFVSTCYNRLRTHIGSFPYPHRLFAVPT